MRKNNFLKILKNKNFLKIFLGQLFSSISAAAINFVLVGKIYSSTGSTVAVGFYLFFYYLPTILLGPFAGVLIDNWSKRKIFIFSNFLQSIIVLFYLGMGKKVWAIYWIVFLYSLCDEFYSPAVLASVPAVVNKNYYSTANSLFLFTSQGAIILGSLVGGIMLKFLPNQNLIFLIISFCLFIVGLLSLSLPPKPLEGTKKLKINFTNLLDLGKTLNLSDFWQQVREGYVFIKNEPRVLFPILLLTGIQILTGIGIVVFPSLAQLLKIPFADASFLLILPIVFGALIGSILVEKKIRKIRKNVIILRGLYFLGTFVFLVPILTLIFKQPIWPVLPLTILLGISYVFIYIPLQTLIQENTPFDVRGRVFGTLTTLVTLAAFFPMLITVSLVDLLGLHFILFITGASIIILASLAKKNLDFLLSLGNKNG